MHRILAAMLAVMLAVPAWAEDAVSLRLNWYMGGVHAPFFLGKERGFYRDAGLDLTINEGRGSANTAQVVAAGTDTFGLANSSSVMRLVSKDRRHPHGDVAAEHLELSASSRWRRPAFGRRKIWRAGNSPSPRAMR